MNVLDKCTVLRHAQGYLDALSRGIDPLTGEMLKPDEVVCKDRIRRCLLYVSDVLGQVIENDGKIGGRQVRKRVRKLPYTPDMDALAAFAYSDIPITATEFVQRVNAYVNTDCMHKLTYRTLTNWLLRVGLVQNNQTANGTMVKRPTEEGRNWGILTVTEYNGEGTPYTHLVYTRKLQEILIQNLPSIAEETEKRTPAETMKTTETENTEL